MTFSRHSYHRQGELSAAAAAHRAPARRLSRAAREQVRRAALYCSVVGEAHPDSAIDTIESVTRAVQGAQLGLADRRRRTGLVGRALA